MLPRTKSKRITVDENRYRYVVTESGSPKGDTVPLSITVQHHEKNGAHLRVVGLTTARVAEKDSKFYMGRTVVRPVKPCHVAQLVRLALSRGWKPKSSGPAFVLSLDNSEVLESGGP